MNYENKLSLDEALSVYNANVKDLVGDYVIVYPIDESKESETDLISPESETDVLDALKSRTIFTVVKTGNKCISTKEGDKVVVHPSAMVNAIPIGLDDCLFVAFGEKNIIAYLNG